MNLTMSGVLMGSLSRSSNLGSGFLICNGLNGNDHNIKGCNGSLIVKGFFTRLNLEVEVKFVGWENVTKTANLLPKRLEAQQRDCDR